MSLEEIRSLLEVYGYLILFPLAVMEGPMVTVIGGFLASIGVFNPFVVYTIIVVGDIAGDAFWYCVGRFGGRGWFAAWVERFFGITGDTIDTARDKFVQHRYKMTLMAKLTYGIGSAGLVAAGLVRVPYLLFGLTCLVISLLQAALFLGLGMLFGEAYGIVAQYLNYVAAGALAISGIGIVAGIWWAWSRRRR